MATVGMKDYERLIGDRPEKFDAQEVNYRENEGKEHCSRCIHFYVRKLDRHAVCEIFRNDEVDKNGIDPYYVCDFFTPDGEKFPLYGVAEAQ